MFRIGHGYDVHAFKAGHEIVLGGVSIPFDKSLEAHSDGDVLLHALCDSLLGAAALGDIGTHFPPSDPNLKNKDSAYFIKQTMQLLAEKRLHPINIDVTVLAERPKLQPYINAMREQIGVLLNLEKDFVSIKATTTEKLGFVGREEGIAAYAISLLGVK